MNLLGLCHGRIYFDLRGQPRPLEAISDFDLKKVAEGSGILKILIKDQIFFDKKQMESFLFIFVLRGRLRP